MSNHQNLGQQHSINLFEKTKVEIVFIFHPGILLRFERSWMTIERSAVDSDKKGMIWVKRKQS